MNVTVNLNALKESGWVRELDVHFASFLEQQERILNPNVSNADARALSWLACLMSQELSRGNVCIDLNRPYPLLSDRTPLEVCPNLAEFHCVAAVGAAVGATDSQTTNSLRRPLVLDQSNECCYLHRYWHYEVQLAHRLLTMSKPLPWFNDEDRLQQLQQELQRLFKLPQVSSSAKATATTDWQAVAASIAALQQFCVISGGPGTGKTTTVIRLLALLCGGYPNYIGRAPIIKLAAPTGKAAMRLSESIKGAKHKLDAHDEIKSLIPDDASTLHRLLKQRRDGGFYHDGQNPLHLDVLILDEASMVDLPMMAKLTEALPDHAQLILLGDKDQLASVEAGSVLGDICEGSQYAQYSQELLEKLEQLTGAMPDFQAGDTIASQTVNQNSITGKLAGHISELKKSYRFHEKSGIGFLARAANQGSVNQWRAVVAAGYEDLSIMSDPSQVDGTFMENTLAHYFPYMEAVYAKSHHDDDSARDIHQLFNQFKILCAVRDGEQGITRLNEQVEQRLKQRGLIQSDWDGKGGYAGRPIMIMENDYNLNLFNGDMGIVLPCEMASSTGEVSTVLKVSFVTADGDVRWIKLGRLPKFETVYAMTIHKSQGSEFDHCALVLPSSSLPVLTKELIYTGITRAKSKLTLIGSDAVIAQSLKQKVQRVSGLYPRLWHSKSSLDSPDTGDEPKAHKKTLALSAQSETSHKHEGANKQEKPNEQEKPSQPTDDDGQFSLF